MPQLTIEGVGTFDVPVGRKLLNALVENGGDPRYRCGGKPKCAVCQVAFISGEPQKMTEAEKAKLEEKDLVGKARLACQCLVEEDMHVKVLLPYAELSEEEKRPALVDQITPEPVWVAR